MATQKPISTISYNTEAFLHEKLEIWLNAHIISAYQYIKHVGEDGDKNHIHLRLEPNKKLDPMDLSDQLKEYKLGEDKPLGVMKWTPSKEDDWLLYVVHDAEYLSVKYKGQNREKMPYKWGDIVVSEGYDVESAYLRAKAQFSDSPSGMAAEMLQGKSGLDLLLNGANPFTINQVCKIVSGNDYARLQAQFYNLRANYEILEAKYHALCKGLEDRGFTILVGANGLPVLEHESDWDNIE